MGRKMAGILRCCDQLFEVTLLGATPIFSRKGAEYAENAKEECRASSYDPLSYLCVLGVPCASA